MGIKNILILTRWAPYPPLRAGAIYYIRNMIEALASVTSVEVLVFRSAAVPPEASARLHWHEIPYAEAGKIASLWTALPNVANRHKVPAYLDAAKRMAASADAVLIDHLGLAPLVSHLVSGFDGRPRPPVILINHNYEAAFRLGLVAGARNLALRAGYAWDAWKSARLERTANRMADGLTAISTTDLAAFRDLAPQTPAFLWMPAYTGPVTAHRRISAETPFRVSIVGGRGPLIKQIVLKRILDAIWARGLQRELIIDVVGNGIEAQSAALRARYPGINFLGFIDDLAAYFATSRLGLIPDEFGGGFKLRALSHIFLRLPMLALPTALGGMGLEPDIDFIPARDLAALLDTLPLAIRDLDRLNAVQEQAFSRAQGRLDRLGTAREFLAFLESLATKPEPSLAAQRPILGRDRRPSARNF